MAKKHKSAKSKAAPDTKSFNPESQPYFTPVAFAVIFLALVFLFREFIFSGKMLFLSDQIQAGVFFRNFLVDYVGEHGAIPQWNPYIFGGMPYVEAFHGDIFYPLSVLKFVLSEFRWQGWTLFLHIFLAGVFMYGAARQFKLSKIASLLSAICYMFASYLISLVSPGHDGKIYVTTLFPLVILFIQRGFAAETKLGAFFNFSMLGAVIGCIILSPHPQMSYFTLWVVALYALFKLIFLYRESRSVVAALRPAVLVGYAVVIGLLISAIQFYPGYIYTNEYSPRADAKRGWEWATSWSMHEEELFSQLIPEFAGANSRTEQTYYWGKNPFKDNSESVGIVSIFIALLGLFFCRRRESYFFGALALLALLYALGATTPIFYLFYHLIPKVKALRAPSMIMFIFSFSTALLAGMGLEMLMSERQQKSSERNKRLNYFIFGFPAFMLLLALLFGVNGKGMLSFWSSIFYSEAPRTMVQAGISRLDLAYMNLPAIQTGAWLAFLFSALVALCLWLYMSKRVGHGILAAMLLIPVIDGVRFNQRFIHTFDQDRYWQQTPLTQFFEGSLGRYRVMNFSSRSVAEDLLPFYGVEVVVGYHGNQLRWYDQLLGGPRKSNETNARFLNLVGAEYLMFEGNQEIPEGYFGPKPVTVAMEYGPVRVFRNENALPRVFLVDQYRVFPDVDQVQREVLGGREDLRQVAYLEQQPSLQIEADTDSLPGDSAWIEDYQIDSVVVGVSCRQNRLLIMTDNYYEAWHVYVDGQPADMLRSYGSFRTVAVPASAERVLFRYDSERYGRGKWVTALTLLYLLVIIGFYFFSSRKSGIVKGEP